MDFDCKDILNCTGSSFISTVVLLSMQFWISLRKAVTINSNLMIAKMDSDGADAGGEALVSTIGSNIQRLSQYGLFLQLF
ncbi:unnamed protein product [Gongylonema pulchrum]|uniref:Transmembrane protein n=1 Tax=Gongylonema pulchrum TaxID=637853 RepID=A0A183DK17_9BILA|nr:unnamed protein product [Gongylonema pulchrum]